MNADLMKYAIGGAILFAAYKYGNGLVKGGVIAIAATAIAARVPYVKDLAA